MRRQWVAASPEEKIRQQIIRRMVEEWGYPLSGIALERSLHHMPHLNLSSLKLPLRRADIVVFAPGIHPHYALYPLLLIECKAVPLTDKVFRQVISYNFYLKAPFVAIANANEWQLGWHDPQLKQFCTLKTIPLYQTLLHQCQITELKEIPRLE